MEKKKMKIKNIFKESIKKILVISMITTNIFFYIPNVTFAADNDDDEKVPATVPAVANEIISKFVSVKSNYSTDSSNTDEFNNEAVIQKAIECHKYLRENGYKYGQIGLEIPDGKKNGKTIDCSSYVSWVLYCAGDDSFKGHQETAFTGNYQKHKLKEVKLSDVQPGDVLVEDGHVELAAEVKNGEITRVYNCGWDGAIQSEGTKEYPETAEVSNKNDQVKLVLRTSGSSDSTKKRTNNKTTVGEAKIEKCNVENGGYDAIFTSGTTGRQFKEYKQNVNNGDWNNKKYPIEHLGGVWPGGWRSECGTVSIIIAGSGYSDKATFSDVTEKMEKSGGNTNVEGWLKDYTGQNCNQIIGFKFSQHKQKIIDEMSKGAIVVMRSANMSGSGHYVAALDINRDKTQVYISNPWLGGSPSGWTDIDSLAGYYTGQTGNNFDSITYLTNDGSKVNYGSGTQIDSLDNFLVIGDSRTYAIENKLEGLGKNVVAKGVSSSTPQHWKEVTKNGSGTVLNTSVTLPSKNSVKGVVVALGVNGTSQVNEMKEVLNNLIARYPDVPIFVTSVFHVGEKYQYGTLTASKMNGNIDGFNNSMQEFCNSNSDLIYIDITSGLYDDKGFLKSSYTDDGLHLNNSGNTILVKNIKEEVLNSGLVSSSDGNGSDVNMSSNIIEIKDPNNPNRTGYKINVDWDKEVEEMLDKLKKKNFKLEKYLDKSLQKEYLKNMLKAAIVTQYPDLRSADEIASNAEIPADETQGCIKIKRYADGETRAFAGNSLSNPIDNDDEDKGMYLAYKPYEQFSKLITSADKSALNYFSMDSSNNLVVAGWETLDVSVSIEQTDGAANPDPNPDSAPEARAKEYEKLVEKKINYIDQVSNYTMQFSLLWSLLVYGNDEDFVNDVAKLVIDTEIVMASYDSTNVKVSTYTNTYTKKIHIDKNAKIGNYVAEEGGYKAEANDATDKEYHYKVTEIHTLKTDTPSIKVKYANTWTAIYNNNYKVKNKDENIPDSSAKLKDEEVEDGVEYKNKEEIKKELEKDESLQKKVDEQIEKLKEEVRKENENKYGYRYEALTNVMRDTYTYPEDSEDWKLLYNKNIQDYIINMVVDYSDGDDLETRISNFKENEIVINCAKKENKERYIDILDSTALCVRRLVEESKIIQDANGSSLYDQLTKNGKDLNYNKVYYDVDVTTIVIEETTSKVDQKEKIETQSTKAEVEEVIGKNKNGNVTMKVDKNSKENSFVKLLYHSKKAKGNLKIIESWFFESMEETAAIADMVDLTKYLFQKVYNEKITYTEEEITEMANLFDPEKFQIASGSNSSNGNTSNDLVSFLEAAEGGDSYINGDEYVVYSTESVDGCLNIGHGVVVAKNGVAWYPDVLPNPYDGQVVSKEIYEKLFNTVIKSKTSNLDAVLAKYNVTLNQNQYDAFVSYCYNCGSDLDLLISTYKSGGQEALWKEWQKYIYANGQPLLGLKRRRSEEYELFIKGDYNYNPTYNGDSVKYY